MTDDADEELDRLADRFLAASRALVAVSAESLDELPESLDLTHFRALAVIGSRNGMSLGEVAEAMRVHPSRASRISDRLVRRRLVQRRIAPDDRRQIVLTATPQGAETLARAWDRRRQAIRRVLARMPGSSREAAATSLAAFAEAAEEYVGTGTAVASTAASELW